MSKTVEDIRRQIDALDDQVHDLLMKRADLVLEIGEAKRKSSKPVISPDREAIMIRRLMARHQGPLPREAVVRIWRELVGAVSLLQTGLRVVVTVPDDATGLIYWDMAKDFFSSVLPMQKIENPLGALAAVREGEATFAVLPWPEIEDDLPWWSYMMDEAGDNPMRIMARLPFGDRSRHESNPEFKALVVARVKFNTSGSDRSFIALDLDHSISRTRILDRSKAMGLTPRSLYSMPARGRRRTFHLLEVDQYVGNDDTNLALLLEKLEDAEGRCLSLGGYPTPVIYEDKVGKNAVDDAIKSSKSSGKKTA